MARVVTFGEIMLRLAPQGNIRLSQAKNFIAEYGGAEANVAVCLSNFGIDSSFVTKLPYNDIAESAINSMRQFGVDTSRIVRGGERIGIYYLEHGASQRSSKVIYDRKYSAIASARRTEFDWDAILSGVKWFHLSGITPALGGEIAEICMDALSAAKKGGCVVSFDLNYRATLWSVEDARKVLADYIPFIDVLISNEEQASVIFGDNVQAIFPQTALTRRSGGNANENDISAILHISGKRCDSKEYRVTIVDRVGSGDAFSAGLIYANLQGFDPQNTVDFAIAASCLKHTIPGDMCIACVEEVNSLLRGNDGRVVR